MSYSHPYFIYTLQILLARYDQKDSLGTNLLEIMPLVLECDEHG